VTYARPGAASQRKAPGLLPAAGPVNRGKTPTGLYGACHRPEEGPAARLV